MVNVTDMGMVDEGVGKIIICVSVDIELQRPVEVTGDPMSGTATGTSDKTFSCRLLIQVLILSFLLSHSLSLSHCLCLCLSLSVSLTHTLTAGEDFEVVPENLTATFLQEQFVLYFYILIIDDDIAENCAETFAVIFTSVNERVNADDSMAIIQIDDDDGRSLPSS